MKISIFLIAFWCIFVADVANAFGLYGYASLRGGISYSMVKTAGEDDAGYGQYLSIDKRNFSFNPTFGTRIVFNNWRTGAFRLEIGYSISNKISMNTDVADYTLENQVGMTNLYFDFYTNSRFKPFVMGGAGYGVLKLATKDILGEKSDDSSKNFVWTVGGGITFVLTSKIYFDFLYHYTNFGRLKSNALEKFEYTASEFQFGVRYMF